MSIAAKPKSWFSKLSPEKRQKVVIFGVVGIGLAVITIGVLLGSPPTTGKRDKAPDDVRNVLLRDNPRDMGLTDVANQQRAQQAQIDALTRELNAYKKREKGEARLGRDPDEALAELSGNVARTQQTLEAPPGTAYNPDRPPMKTVVPGDTSLVRPVLGDNAGPPPPPPPPPTAPQIQTVTQSAPAAPAKARKPQLPVYLPTGAMITGTLINGLDAPTGRAAQSAPIPVVVRIKHEAILPSRYRSDVREAFVLASGYGDLSSERAYLRAERLSMILNDGQVIDIPIKMAAVGSDAKAGLRGRIVSKQGAIIAKALLAGTADGISRAFSNSYSVGGYGNDNASAGEIGMSGLSGGASTALDRVAAYFLSQAESMYPIVEVDGGREVTFILLEGVDLAPRVVDPETATAAASEKGA